MTNHKEQAEKLTDEEMKVYINENAKRYRNKNKSKVRGWNKRYKDKRLNLQAKDSNKIKSPVIKITTENKEIKSTNEENKSSYKEIKSSNINKEEIKPPLDIFK